MLQYLLQLIFNNSGMNDRKAISDREGMILPFYFFRQGSRITCRFVLPQRLWHIFKHILNKDAVARGGVADEHMRDRPHDPAVLHDGAA